MNISFIRFFLSAFFLFFLQSSLFSLESINKSSILSEKEKNWIKEHPIIHVGADQNWPPFDYVDKNKVHKGIASDYIELMQETLGIKFVVHSDEWKNVLESVKEKKLDMLSCSGVTESRKEFLNFSNPYVEIDTIIVARKNDKRIKNIEDLDGLYVALPKNNFVHDQLKKSYPKIKYYFTKSNEEAVQAVALGKANAYVGNLAVAGYFIQQNMLTNLKIVAKTPFEKTKLSFAVRKDYQELVSIFDKFLSQVSQKNKNKILEKWLPPISYAEISKREVNLSDEEKKWLKEHPVIKIGVDPSYAPYEFINSAGKHVGISADYLKLIEEILNIKFKVVPNLTWQEVLQSAKNRTIDLVPLATPTDGRKKYLNFTKTYTYGPTVIFMKKSAKKITGLKDLSNKTVAVPKGFSDIDVIKINYPNIKILEVENSLKLLQDVATGKADGGALNVGVGNYLIQKQNLTNLKIAAYANTSPGALAMGVRSDYPILVSILDKTLASITEHEHQAIRKTWVPLINDADSIDATVSLTQEELEWLKLHPKVRLGIDKEWEPIEYLNKDGELAGVSGSIVKQIERMLDISFVIDPKLNWYDTIEKAKIKEIDAISAIKKTASRSKYLDFTKSYISIPNLIFTTPQNEYIDSMQQLKNKTVAVVKGYAVEEIMQNFYSDIELISVDSVEDGLKKLSKGEVDAFIDSAIVTSHYISKLGYAQLKISGEFPHTYNLSFAVRDDWKIFTKILQKSLDAITKEKIQDMYKKNVSIRYEKNIDYSLIWQISFIALLILGITFYWNRRLSHEVSLRKKAEDEANVANRAKSMFLANMSHEIRTPMNAVMGMLYLVQKTELDEVQKNYIQKAHNAASSLLGIINDILDFSKIEANKLQLEKVDFELEEVILNISNIIGYKAEEKGIEFLVKHDSNIPKLLVGDSLRLGQVLINLTSNAVKFTENGEVILSEKLIKSEDDIHTIEFCVKDSGIGMSSDELKKLFQEFTQVDSSMTRKYGGTGLGLTISKKLVSLMGGEIWIEHSEIGKGSIFCFTVKLESSKHDIKNLIHAQTLPEKFKHMNVLVVDDNKSARDVLKHMLSSFGFKIDTASNSQNAISAIKQCDDNEMYDLILIDWKMPDLNGLETSKLIKADKTILKQPKIIMITAYPQEELVDEVDKAGLDGFLIKPVSPSLLFNSIMHAFGKVMTEDTVISTELSLDSIIGAEVLLVEDNEMNQEFAVALLSSVGLEIDIAQNGLEAIQIVQEKHYDAILMDIQMPKMDGIEATYHIRKLSIQNNDKYYKDVPIIAMTALAMDGDKEKSINAGMNDHITKPIEPNILFETLLKWIKPRKKISTKKVKKTDDTSLELPKLKGIFVEEGLKRLANDTKIYKRILLQFKQKYSDVMSEIKLKIQNNDIKSAEYKCHELKGVSGNIGAHNLLRTVTELDNTLKTGKKPSKEELQNVSKELNIVIDSISSLENLEKKNNTKNTEKFDILEALKLLENILRNLDNDIGKVEDDLEILEEVMNSSKEIDEFKELSNKITTFDIDGAKVAIKKLIEKLKDL